MASRTYRLSSRYSWPETQSWTQVNLRRKGIRAPILTIVTVPLHPFYLRIRTPRAYQQPKSAITVPKLAQPPIMKLLTLTTLSLAALTAAIHPDLSNLACSRRPHGIGYECQRTTATTSIARRAVPASSVHDSASGPAPTTTSPATRPAPKCVHFGWLVGSDCTSPVFHAVTSVHATASSTSGYSEYPSYSSGPKETNIHSGTTRALSTLRLAQASSSSSGTRSAISTSVVTRTTMTSDHTTTSTGGHTTVATTVPSSSSVAGTSTVKTTRTSTAGSPGATAVVTVGVVGLVAAIVL
ncbi:hypothetical protein GE09DRAFT_1247889 [Coniochaeta sp. 2T2.1]|nr:hypothetical protein GE09DRAFT_1247889 [Coniochaeta sp. 2T2.1]